MPTDQNFEFLCESNRIEGIFAPPTPFQREAFLNFMGLPKITLDDCLALQGLFAPGMPLRERYGLNVRVGDHIPPPGGPLMRTELEIFLSRLSQEKDWHPYDAHQEFEHLHPFMDGNGRTGRMLWAWHMFNTARNPFSLPFLHRWYYQSLERNRA